jgi:hypothetical protein
MRAIPAYAWYKHTQPTPGKSNTSEFLSWAVLVLVMRCLAIEEASNRPVSYDVSTQPAAEQDKLDTYGRSLIQSVCDR